MFLLIVFSSLWQYLENLTTSEHCIFHKVTISPTLEGLIRKQQQQDLEFGHLPATSYRPTLGSLLDTCQDVDHIEMK